MSLAAHVLAHLVATGAISPTGSARRAKIRTCPTCRAVILHGDDNDRCAFETVADPTPLNAHGEAWALASGRRTVALARDKNGLVLWARNADQITGKPAGTNPREDVLATHVCGQPIPAELACASRFTPSPASRPPLDPPF